MASRRTESHAQLFASARETEKRMFWKPKVEEIMKELPDSYDITDAFVQVFKDALQKLLKVR